MFKVELDVSCLDKALNGLKPGGEVQLFVDTEIIKHCDPYVPMKQGILMESPLYASEIGHGKIIYDTPYAKRMYNAPDDWKFQNGPLRGPNWVTRMWADRGDEIMQGAAKLALKNTGGGK